VRAAFSGIEKHKLNNAYVLQMNAENLGFEDGSFDLALCGFVGWDYCFDFVRGESIGPDTRLEEIRRVLKAGGRVGFSSWERQDDIEWMEEMFLRHFPSIASDHEKDVGRRPLVYSKESTEGFQKILRNGGFEAIEIFKEKAEFVSTDEEEWWEQMRRVGWYRYFERIEGVSSEELHRFKKAVFSALHHYKQADGIHFTKSVFFVFGTK
jgi:SAM-dependent methyltransferase